MKVVETHVKLVGTKHFLCGDMNVFRLQIGGFYMVVGNIGSLWIWIGKEIGM